ncbi:hypothetical protein OSB04_012478 [Centaurea solstitialis]|uniref:Uncharacterized protein n=1 Tax=Centaurea solstitialis TaxID=347529 RepID=A0AA38TBF4_9ASTR|nr:hypothetical protein OSB04_012478 [Centaurea solstitialis]
MERAQSGLRSQKLKCGRSIQNCFQIDFGDEILRIEREREREIEKERDEERRMEKKEKEENFGIHVRIAQLWEIGSFSFVNRRIVVKFGQRLQNSLFFNLTGGIEHRRLQEPHALDELRGQTRVLSWRAIKGNHMPLELIRLRAKARPRLDSETEDSSNRILTIVAMKPFIPLVRPGREKRKFPNETPRLQQFSLSMKLEDDVYEGMSVFLGCDSAETRAVRDSEVDQQVTIGSSTYRRGLELEMQGRRVIVFQLTAEETMKELDVLSGGRLPMMCTMAKARKHVLLGGSNYLVEKTVVNVPVVSDFPDVFPDDLPDISHERQVEFRIKLVPGVVSVAKTCTE